ncbi:MAG: homoserine dehydrogenase [Chloroflexota bacterium]
MAEGIQIGLLGAGVIGSGVLAALTTRADLFAERCGRPVTVKRVLVRNTGKPHAAVAPTLLTADPAVVLDDPEISLVVEVMGGDEPAYAYARRALQAGKHLVTANKEMLAKHGAELLDLAAKRRLEVGFEASVGGGIPIIAALRRNLVANRVVGVRGIVNGTTNYILTEMESKGRDFAAALAEAQSLGYAEPDPTNDVQGYDSRYKLVILCALAFGAWARPQAIFCEGITGLTPIDFRLARDLGYAIRLIAEGRPSEEGLVARVQPTLVPLASPLAGTKGVFNAIAVQGDLVGDLVLSGRGAGAEPTASAVLADVASIVRGERVPALSSRQPATLAPAEAIAGRFYVRIAGGGKEARDELRHRGIGTARIRFGEDGTLAMLTKTTTYGALRGVLVDMAAAHVAPVLD